MTDEIVLPEDDFWSQSRLHAIEAGDKSALQPETVEENDEHVELRERAQADFFVFAREVLGRVTSLTEWKENDGIRIRARSEKKTGDEYGISRLTPHADAVRLFQSDRSFFKLLLMPRGTFKTSLRLDYLNWEVVHDLNLRCFYCMDTIKEARKKVGMLRRRFKSEKSRLRLVYPWLGIESTDDNGAFTVLGRTDADLVDPTFEPGAPQADFTGSHRDRIDLDDPVNWKDARSQDKLELTRDFFGYLLPLLDSGGMFCGTGTRYSDGDLWGHIMDEHLLEYGGEFEKLVITCGMQLAQREDKTWYLKGTPIFPHEHEAFLYSKLQGGHLKFSSQYLNEPLSGETQIFFREQFVASPWHEWMQGIRWFLLTDAAYTTTDKGCYSVIAVAGLDAADNAYLADLRVMKVPVNQWCDELLDVAEVWTSGQWDRNLPPIRFRKVLIEPSTRAIVDSMLQDKMRERQMRLPIRTAPRGKAQGAKDDRIQASAGRFERKGFIVLDTVPKHFHDGAQRRILWDATGGEDGLPIGELVNQYTRFPLATYKDIADALADLDVTDKDGSRICKGGGQKVAPTNHIEAMFGSRVRSAVQTRRQKPSIADRWAAINRTRAGA